MMEWLRTTIETEPLADRWDAELMILAHHREHDGRCRTCGQRPWPCWTLVWLAYGHRHQPGWTNEWAPRFVTPTGNAALTID
jgi:hypothetical protein